MKADELMIGDWVQIQYRDKRVKVTDIYDGKIYTTAISPLMEDEFAPIPLTPEILEKNGFKIIHGFGYSESYPTYGWGYHKGLRDYASVIVRLLEQKYPSDANWHLDS